jgi:hypothetical protein
MTKLSSTPASAVLVAIDMAKNRQEVLICTESDPRFSSRSDPGGWYVPRCGLWVKLVFFR